MSFTIKDYKNITGEPTPPQSEPPKRWHIIAIAFLVVILAVDWEATLTTWGF